MFGEEIDLAARGIYDAVESMQAPFQPRNQPITLLAPDWAPIPFLRRAWSALDHLEAQIYAILDQRRSRSKDNEPREDLLSMLLAAGVEMSDEQIRDEMLTFLFAGHETTALTLGYVLDLLTRNREAERRLHEELDEIRDEPTIEDVAVFEYAEAIVRETLRLYPPAHEIRREPATDVTSRATRFQRARCSCCRRGCSSETSDSGSDPTRSAPSGGSKTPIDPIMLISRSEAVHAGVSASSLP